MRARNASLAGAETNQGMRICQFAINDLGPSIIYLLIILVPTSLVRLPQRLPGLTEESSV